MLSAEDQYAANCAVLAAQPAMAPLLAQLAQMPLVNLQLQPGPEGALIGCVWDVPSQTWVPLCDLQRPVAAAEEAAAQLWSPQQTVYTLLGVGLGYAVAALAKRLLPYQRLVVWDADGALFKAMLYCLDIREIFSGKRVEIYVGTDLLQRIDPWYLSLEVQEKLHLALPVNHLYTMHYRKAEYQALLDRIMEMLRFHMVGLATWRQFGHCIGDNDIANMPEYFATPGLAALRGLWQGKPAVCVAAGPSLQRNLRHLLPAAVRAQVALITVGTTYGLLQGLGLQPDIVTTIDFQRLNHTDQFAHIPLDPDCALVYLHSTYPQTVRRWPGPLFVAENSSDTMAWMRQFAGEEKGSAGQVQTVAHLNLLVAIMLGANPIILLGQDLSMPPTEHHAPGARAQDSAPADQPPEAFLETVDLHGRKVLTRHSFQSMLLVFERIVAEHPETTFVNASEQGLPIKGMVSRPFSEVVADLTPADDPAAVPSRPAFQGETPALLAQRRRAPLQDAIRQVHAAYVPQTTSAFPEAFDRLCQDVETIGQWARETVARWETVALEVPKPGALAVAQQYLQWAAHYFASREYGPRTALEASHGEEVEGGIRSSQQELARWQALRSATLPPAMAQAALSTDVFSDADTIEMLREPTYQSIIASEQVFAARPHATGMFIIRRFDFLELKGEIPPPADSMPFSWQQARYGAHRVARAAAMFLEELPTLRLLLRRARMRMRQSDTVPRALARQQYRQALQMLREPLLPDNRLVPPDAVLRLLAEVYRQTQQYSAALALMDGWQQFPTAQTAGTVRHAARIRTYLARYAADVRHALPAYFHEPPGVEAAGQEVMQAWLALLPVSLAPPVPVPLPAHVNGSSPAPPVPVVPGAPIHAPEETPLCQ